MKVHTFLSIWATIPFQEPLTIAPQSPSGGKTNVYLKSVQELPLFVLKSCGQPCVNFSFCFPFVGCVCFMLRRQSRWRAKHRKKNKNKWGCLGGERIAIIWRECIVARDFFQSCFVWQESGRQSGVFFRFELEGYYFAAFEKGAKQYWSRCGALGNLCLL